MNNPVSSAGLAAKAVHCTRLPCRYKSRPGWRSLRDVPLILLNKPFRVLSQFTDPGNRPTLADYVDVPGVYPAGRLDYDSEGLIVLTDDGRLQARISQPRSKITKVYRVQVEGLPDNRQLARLESGVHLKDGTARALGVRQVAEPADLWPRDPADPGAQIGARQLARDRRPRRPEPHDPANDRGRRTADAQADPLAGRPVAAGRSQTGRVTNDRQPRRVARTRYGLADAVSDWTDVCYSQDGAKGRQIPTAQEVVRWR